MWLPKLPSGNVQYAAGYYRLKALHILKLTNAVCLLLPLFGPFLRRGDGPMTLRDGLFAILTVLVSLTLPSISCFIFYAGQENWKRLREEKIFAFHGRYLLASISIVALCGIGGSVHSIIFADYELHIPQSVDPIRPSDMSLESRLLIWFTGVSIFLVLAFIFHLMPVDPYATLHQSSGESSAEAES